MAASYEQIESRTMSGTGTLRIPKDSSYRDFLIYAQVIRRPKNEYNNFDWSPPKSMYARISFSIDGYVQSNEMMDFTKQIYRITVDQSGQALVAIQCAYKGILQSFVNIVGCLPSCAVVGVIDNTAPMSALVVRTTDIVFNMYADTAIRVILKGLKYDECGDEQNDSPPPPPPPPPSDEVPPGTPIDDISPPYDSDDNFTDPFDLDSEDPLGNVDLPTGQQCVAYDVSATVLFEGDNPQTTVLPFYGEILDVALRTENGCTGVYVLAFGYAFNPANPCAENASWLNLYCKTDSLGEVLSWNVNSITERADN